VGIRGHILVLFPVAVVAVGCSLLETKDECIRRCNSNADEVFSRLEHVCPMITSPKKFCPILYISVQSHYDLCAKKSTERA